MNDTADYLVIAPHPDDSEFGAAGSVAQWAKEGKRVVYVICTNGDKGTSDRELQPEQLVKIREEEQKKAADVLGVREVVFLGFPDQGLEDTPEFRKEVVRVIRKYCPPTVVTVDPSPRYISHRDHRIAGRVVLDAVYPFARDHLAFPDLLEEGYEPHKVQEVLLWGSSDMNYLSDISDTFPLKIEALKCHTSQIGERDLERMEEGMKARYRALAEGEEFELAEGFHRVVLPR